MIKTKSIALIVGVAIMSLTLGCIAFAWTGPTGAPPTGNVPKPLNESITAQAKLGSLVLGANSTITTGLIVQYGNVGIGTSSPSLTNKLEVNGNVSASAYYYTSDIRLKENVLPIENSLSKILKLEGIKYNLKSTKEDKLGFSAQDLQKVFPELVKEGDDGYLSIDGVGLIAPLVEAIKEQQKIIELQQIDINNLKLEINNLKVK